MDTEARQEGRTGHPVVDAAVRQLSHEGWMPGRTRLLAAGFLAINQLSRQWVACTGTDTRPNRSSTPASKASVATPMASAYAADSRTPRRPRPRRPHGPPGSGPRRPGPAWAWTTPPRPWS
ncbi:FAD-binding domain-containing protein [Streptomyces sp. NPDC012935]|uniref:FAD-binding domain-containing protein n=1 Tax=Streptomyces sp. NPDC012935 TaxID=3364857 RepID=UPI0036A54531